MAGQTGEGLFTNYVNVDGWLGAGVSPNDNSITWVGEGLSGPLKVIIK